MIDVESIRPLTGWLASIEARKGRGEEVHPLEEAAYTAVFALVAFAAGQPYRTGEK